ncbi:hypothetical protein [Sphingobium xenophagum]|uniref:hypothetical protein n=1 Tax=Sphingobium xenophagum TaxID=121428 RepID=UPI0012F86400|nr:hypothetical protein [Sphingobium xenophagum]
MMNLLNLFIRSLIEYGARSVGPKFSILNHKSGTSALGSRNLGSEGREWVEIGESGLTPLVYE